MTEHKQINVHTSTANMTEQVSADTFNNVGAKCTKFKLSILVYSIQWGLSHWNKNSDVFIVFFFLHANKKTQNEEIHLFKTFLNFPVLTPRDLLSRGVVCLWELGAGLVAECLLTHG